MSDLISSLADQIIALVNSKPSSPRKEEVEAAIRAVVGEVEAPQVVVNGVWLALVLERAGMDMPADLPLSPVQRLVEDHLAKHNTKLEPMPDKSVSAEMLKARDAIRQSFVDESANLQKNLTDAMNTTVYGGPTVEDREKFWANKLNEPFDKASKPCEYGEARGGRHDFLAGRCYCGAYEY